MFAELEYRIGPSSTTAGVYPVYPMLRIGGQDQIFPPGTLTIDLDELFNLRAQVDQYDAHLSRLFFRDGPIQDAFSNAVDHLDQAGVGHALRVRLLIENDARELHGVRWECLRDSSGKRLFCSDAVLFSRYLSSSHLRPLRTSPPRNALVAIANPPHLDQAINPEDPQTGLAPVNVPGEKARAESSLSGAGFSTTTLTAAPFGTAPATLDNILKELAKGYDVFYLVCHGGLVGSGASTQPMLWLEDSQDPIDAAKLVEGIRNIDVQPRLVVLASCQSAGTDAAASGTLGALGPLLADAGVPAVIAMQGNIKMTTVDQFMPRFFSELARDGQIDRAMGKARGQILDCTDYWMPTLFMRLSEGLLWDAPPPAQAAAPNIFADASKHLVTVPRETVLDDHARLGVLKASDPAAWSIALAPRYRQTLALFRPFGAGRIIALAHDKMLTFQLPQGGNPFLEQAIAWLSPSNPAKALLSAKARDTLVIFASDDYSPSLVESEYGGLGLTVERVTDTFDAAKLKDAGLVLIGNSWGDFAPEEIAALRDWVKAGGGLLAAGLAWSWSNAHRQSDLTAYPMNRLFAEFGAAWSVI